MWIDCPSSKTKQTRQNATPTRPVRRLAEAVLRHLVVGPHSWASETEKEEVEKRRMGMKSLLFETNDGGGFQEFSHDC